MDSIMSNNAESILHLDIGELVPLRVDVGYRAGIVPAGVVLNALKAGQAIHFKGMLRPITLTSSRIRTFLEQPYCAQSGHPIEYFAIELAPHAASTAMHHKQPLLHCGWHLQAYALVKGREMMMTSDHIIPRSQGGRDYLRNRQALLSEINIAKMNIMTLADIEEADRRNLWQDHPHLDREFFVQNARHDASFLNAALEQGLKNNPLFVKKVSTSLRKKLRNQFNHMLPVGTQIQKASGKAFSTGERVAVIRGYCKNNWTNAPAYLIEGAADHQMVNASIVLEFELAKQYCTN